MDFWKIVMMVILVIAMATSILFGVIDIVKLSIDLGQEGIEITENIVNENGGTEIVKNRQDKDMLEIWRSHLKEITFSGLSLAVTWMGWKSIKEYYDEKDAQSYEKARSLD